MEIFLLHDLRAHIEAKFAAATVDVSPFPHLVISDFLPQDVFVRLLDYNPFKVNDGVEWQSKTASHNVSSRTPYHARKQINFHKNQSFEAPASQLAFWHEIKECFLGDDWFPRLVFNKYPAYFEIRFGDLVTEPDFPALFTRELFLQRHEPGYYIGPHTDIPTRVFTCIFSLAERPGFEEYGTELLVHKDRLARCWGNDHYAPNDFVVKKIAPYAPNNFLLFFKTRQSFHSVKAIPEEVPNQRYGMQFQFYEPYPGLMSDLSVPDLLSHHSSAPAPLAIRIKSKIRSLVGA